MILKLDVIAKTRLKVYKHLNSRCR